MITAIATLIVGQFFLQGSCANGQCSAPVTMQVQSYRPIQQSAYSSPYGVYNAPQAVYQTPRSVQTFESYQLPRTVQSTVVPRSSFTVSMGTDQVLMEAPQVYAVPQTTYAIPQTIMTSQIMTVDSSPTVIIEPGLFRRFGRGLFGGVIVR